MDIRMIVMMNKSLPLMKVVFKSNSALICVLLHNLRGRTVECAPMSLLSLSKVVAVRNPPVSDSPKQADADAGLLSNKTSSSKETTTMVALSPAKISTRKEISSDSDLNFSASGRSTLEYAPPPPPVKPLDKKQKPTQANVEATVLNISEPPYFDLPDLQNDSEEYDPLLAYKTKRGLEPGKNQSEAPHPQTSNASDVTSSSTSVTETTILPSESSTETTTTSGSDTEKAAMEETTTPASPQAINQNEPNNDIKSTKPIKSTNPEPSTDQPKPNETGTQSGVDESTTQKISEHYETTKATNPTGSPRNSDEETGKILPTKDNGNATGTDDTPIVEYENDPKWYGDPKTLILDDYEVFKLRGCADFSCKHDFE